MSTDRHERLADLAGHTSPASPPLDLWVRGVRRRRVVAAGRVAVAVVLAFLVGVGGWTWHQTRPIQPAETHGAGRLPDRFFHDLSPWTRAFSGPPGPLVTVFPNQRETLRHSTTGIIGITAGSSTYGFVGLPDDAVTTLANSDVSLALSPDGRYLAFWVSGTPEGPPNTELEGVTVTGVATYDTVTGQVRESHFPTRHGVDPTTLLWVDDSTLVLSYYQVLGADGSANAGAAHFGAAATWNVTDDRPTPVTDQTFAAELDSGFTRATDGQVILQVLHPRRWMTGDPGDAGSVTTFRTDRTADLLVLSPDHRRAIGVLTGGSDHGPLAVTRVPRLSGGTSALRPLSFGDRWVRPLAWLDDEHVAVSRKVLVHDPVNGDYVGSRVDSVDLATGSTHPLLSGVGFSGSSESDPWIATDFLGAPGVEAERPPSPLDLRAWTIGLSLAAGLVLLVGASILWGAWRGRRA
jgi:hypothetical protein